MSTIEEQILNYIDGNCSLAEKSIIEAKIASDKAYDLLYQSLLAVNQQLIGLELEEPSMSFTRNVMGTVKLELKPVALQTKINHKIIYGIAALFICSILFVLGYAIATSNFKTGFSTPKLPFSLAIDDYINPTLLKIFLFIDVVLALIYLDGFLRKRTFKKT